jgi:hypothetical protein
MYDFHLHDRISAKHDTRPQAVGLPLIDSPCMVIQFICSCPPHLDAISSILSLRTRHVVVTKDLPSMGDDPITQLNQYLLRRVRATGRTNRRNAGSKHVPKMFRFYSCSISVFWLNVSYPTWPNGICWNLVFSITSKYKCLPVLWKPLTRRWEQKSISQFLTTKS